MLTDDQAKALISQNVERLLEKRGINQSKLAELSGESEMNISRLISGKSMPRAGLLARVAEALEVTIDRLLMEPPKEPPRKIAKAS
jgi:transcriptional regulator with XRE-family HTH domain